MDSEPPLFAFLFFTEFLSVFVFVLALPFAISLLVVLMLCSALISGSEVAFFSIAPPELDMLRNEKSKTASRILQLRSTPRRLLATILITNNLVNVAIIILSAYIMLRVMPSDTFMSWAGWLVQLPLFNTFSAGDIAYAIVVILTVVIILILLIFFGAMAPRVYAKLNAVRFARIMARSMYAMVWFLNPLSRLLVGWSQSIEDRLHRLGNGMSADAAIKDDIDKAIDLAMPQDVNSRLEAGILKSIIKFNDVPVKQIMRSRVDVIAIDDQLPFSRLKEIVRAEGYSRMPVYKENLDNVLGILYVKDLIGEMDRGDEFQWQELVHTEVLYVPESKKINELLKEFQTEHMHMGIVVDEYGGTAGIVTLEDVMEEVIGEIKDEFDEAVEGDYRKIDQNTYLFDGKVLLNDACRIIDVDSSKFDLVRGDADSLAGLVLELSGKMPERGEEFNVAGVSFTVISVSPRRVEKIRVRLPGKTEKK